MAPDSPSPEPSQPQRPGSAGPPGRPVPSVGFVAIRRQLVFLVVWSMVIHAIAITIFTVAHMQQRSPSVRQTFMAIWMGATLLVVLVQLRRIRRIRRGQSR